MQIAVITTSQIPSNTANSLQVMKVCQSYCQLGHEVTLIVPGKKTTEWNQISTIFGIDTEFSIRYVPTNKIFKRYDFSIIIGLFLLFNEFDVVHTWLPQIALIAGFLGKPYIMELHGMPTGAAGPKLYKKILFSNHHKKFLCITNALKGMFEKEYSFKFNKTEIQIAPNGVVLEPYSINFDYPKIKSDLGLTNSFTAVYTGHLYEGRGMNLLIDIARRMKDIQFLWVGGRDDDVRFWRNYIQENQIHNITLTGFIENKFIPNYQKLAEVLLMPYETQIAGSSGGNSVDFCSPMKMFEYMAAGRPIISSDLPILHEVLNERNAIFCQYDDVDQWVNAIELIKKDTGYGHELAIQARLDVEKYTWIERAKKSLDGFVG